MELFVKNLTLFLTQKDAVINQHVALGAFFTTPNSFHTPFGLGAGNQTAPYDFAIALTHVYGHYLAYYGYRQVHLWPHVSDQALLASHGRGEITDFEPYFLEATRGFDLFLVTHFAELDNQPALKQTLLQYPIYSQSAAHVLYDLR